MLISNIDISMFESTYGSLSLRMIANGTLITVAKINTSIRGNSIRFLKEYCLKLKVTFWQHFLFKDGAY